MRLIIRSSVAVLTLSIMNCGIAAEAVNIDNFKRAETDTNFTSRVNQGCFAKLCNERGPMPVADQRIARLSRDTPYSVGVFDLSTPLTIDKPDSGSRFQSLMVINEDHYIKLVAYKPGRYVLTRKKAGTRYVMVMVRTFMDPKIPADMDVGHRVQDRIKVSQKSAGKFDVPNWDQAQRQKLHDTILTLSPFVSDSKGMFGDKADTDPVRHLLGTAGGWGGNAAKDALYLNVTPKSNDGQVEHKLTVKNVPVDGFWSITVYNPKGFYEAPENATSVNNVAAEKSADGSVTVHFGGDPKKPNYLRIMPGWNYTVRLYQARQEVIDGRWKFPEATAD